MPLKTVCKKSDYKVEEIRNQLHINCQKPNLKGKAGQKLLYRMHGERNFSMEMPNPSRRSKKKSLTSCKDQKVLLFYNEKKKKAKYGSEMQGKEANFSSFSEKLNTFTPLS